VDVGRASSASASRRSRTGSGSAASITTRFQEDELEALELVRLREVMVEASLALALPMAAGGTHGPALEGHLMSPRVAHETSARFSGEIGKMCRARA